ncbi:MAG: hypothetical protein AAGE94_17265, partial [Acidobacteriota bacterium]
VGVAYESDVESNARWALVWSATGMRLKVFTQDNGTGVVSASAAADRFTRGEWQRLTQELFRAVHVALGE